MNRWIEQAADAWRSRTPREQVLLGGLGALIVAVAFWYGLVAPLYGWARAAEARHTEAAEDLAQAEAMSRAVAQAEQMRGGSPGGAPSEQVRAEASAAGVQIGREAPQGGALSVWTGPTSARAVFAWLTTLQRKHGVGVRSFEAHQADGGLIEVRAVLAGSGA